MICTRAVLALVNKKDYGRPDQVLPNTRVW